MKQITPKKRERIKITKMFIEIVQICKKEKKNKHKKTPNNIPRTNAWCITVKQTVYCNTSQRCLEFCNSSSGWFSLPYVVLVKYESPVYRCVCVCVWLVLYLVAANNAMDIRQLPYYRPVTVLYPRRLHRAWTCLYSLLRCNMLLLLSLLLLLLLWFLRDVYFARHFEAILPDQQLFH